MIKKEQFKIIVDNLREGMSIGDSCTLAGVSRNTFYSWEKTDKKRWAECEKALLSPKKNCIGIIRKAAVTSWQAAAWLLERKYQNEFCIKNKTEVTINTFEHFKKKKGDYGFTE